MPSVISLIYQAIKGVVGGLDDTMRGQIYEKTSLTDEMLHYYSKARPLFKMDEKERKSAFEKAVSRAREIVHLLNSEEIEELDLLKQILNENVDGDKQIQTEKPIKTLVDKDAKLGYKTKKELIFGYREHATFTDEGIITAVEVTSAAE